MQSTKIALERIGNRRGADGFSDLSDVFSIAAGIIILVQSFKVKNILNSYFTDQLHREIKFSGVATFFFRTLYLQYKINRF